MNRERYEYHVTIDSICDNAGKRFCDIFDSLKDFSPIQMHDILLEVTPKLVEVYCAFASICSAEYYEQRCKSHFHTQYTAALSRYDYSELVKREVSHGAVFLFEGNLEHARTEMKSTVASCLRGMAGITTFDNGFYRKYEQ